MTKANAESMRSHNVLISGKSGSGKTEILRQTAKICNSPFIKVEAVRYTEVGYHGDDVENIISDLFKKTKNEFYKNLRINFWKLKSVKKAWENFALGYLLGKHYEKHHLYNFYKERLHDGDLENVDIQIWFGEKDRVEQFKISDIKNNFYRECFDKLSMNIDFDEILKKNIEERAIICIDEFDKLIKDVRIYLNKKFSFRKLLCLLQKQVMRGYKTTFFLYSTGQTCLFQMERRHSYT